MQRALYCFWLLISTLTISTSVGSEPLAPAKARLRRPTALLLAEKDQVLLVGNRRSGSVSVLDLAAGKVTNERDLTAQLSSLAAIPGTRVQWLLATDEAKHQLLLIRRNGTHLHVEQRLPVSPYPVQATVSDDGRRVYVASLWSRQLSIFDLRGTTAKDASQPSSWRLQPDRTIDLPFAPRELLCLDTHQRLIIGDAFGGRLGILDTSKKELVGVRAFPGHNIRGLGLSSNGRMLIVAHQMLNELAHTVRNDVHWGLLMSNDLRWLRLDGVLRGEDLYEGAHMHPLGEAGSATGDPNQLIVAPDGSVVVSLGGVGEIALGSESDFSLTRVKVGRRPTGLAIDDAGKRAYVANTFDDSVTVVDLEKRRAVRTFALGRQPQLTLVDEGEILFYDASLSHDGWMSCHSCHTDGHTNGMLNDNLSDATFGAPKRVLSLLGKFDTAPFAWDGSAASVAGQIRNSIEKTMQSDAPPQKRHVEALTAYLETLAAPPSIDRTRHRFDAPATERGKQLFQSLQCTQCHAPPKYTTPQTYDVGLKDKLGKSRFNPPSLRGVGQRGPYFHDNRAASLKDVFQKHQHQLDQPLKEQQLADLLAFLRSL